VKEKEEKEKEKEVAEKSKTHDRRREWPPSLFFGLPSLNTSHNDITNTLSNANMK